MIDFDHQIMSEDYKIALLETIYTRSFRHDPDKGFTLSSGAKTDVYIDAKKTSLTAEGMEVIGFAFFQLLKNEAVDAVGGLTLGADPIAYATAFVCTQRGKPLDAFVVRKEPKAHGTMQWIEGNVKEGAWVAIVDDVVTTGASTITAIERAREAGFNVRRVIALVDRQEGGAENIKEKTGLRLESIFKKSEFVELHKKMTGKKKKPKGPAPF